MVEETKEVFPPIHEGRCMETWIDKTSFLLFLGLTLQAIWLGEVRGKRPVRRSDSPVQFWSWVSVFALITIFIGLFGFPHRS